MNAIGALGLLVTVAGLALCLRMLVGALRAAARRRRFRALPKPKADDRAYAGAVAASQVYVPGTIAKQLLGLLLGLVVLALGGALIGVGLMLDLHFERIPADGPVPVGTIAVSSEAGGMLSVRYREGEREWVSPALPGTLVVVYGEYLLFDQRLAPVGLTAYQRVTNVRSYARSADVYINQAQAIYDLRAASPLWRWLERTQLHQQWIITRRHFSTAIGAGPEPRGLYAARDGYIVRKATN
jgi:hypothetical protein